MKRGEVYLINCGEVRGSEQGGIRPALIIQNDIGNLYSPTTIIAVLTTAQGKHNLPTHIKYQRGEANLLFDGYILCEQLRTIDKSRLKQYIGTFSIETIERVNKALKISLNLP